jgi:hypothetical protein
MVSVLPEIEPGPDATLKVTALPDPPPVADKAIGETPNVTGDDGAVKLMVCGALLTTRVPADTVAEGKLGLLNDAVIE